MPLEHSELILQRLPSSWRLIGALECSSPAPVSAQISSTPPASQQLRALQLSRYRQDDKSQGSSRRPPPPMPPASGPTMKRSPGRRPGSRGGAGSPAIRCLSGVTWPARGQGWILQPCGGMPSEGAAGAGLPGRTLRRRPPWHPGRAPRLTSTPQDAYPARIHCEGRTRAERKHRQRSKVLPHQPGARTLRASCAPGRLATGIQAPSAAMPRIKRWPRGRGLALARPLSSWPRERRASWPRQCKAPSS